MTTAIFIITSNNKTPQSLNQRPLVFTQFKIFWKREASDSPIDCQVNNTVKAQKSMKGIVKIVHLPSVVQSELYEATRIIFVRKEIKITTLFNNCLICVTVATFWRISAERKLCMLFCVSRTTRIRCFHSNLCGAAEQNSVRSLHSLHSGIFSKMAVQWCRWDELLNKSLFIFFAYKKHSCRFIKLKLNDWWQMDYFYDAFHTFLGLDSVI